jgi:hypothetical protein
MQAGSIVVATEVRLFEIEVSEGMSSVNDDLDAPGFYQSGDCFDGHDLTGDVDDVGDQDHFCLRRDGLLEFRGDVVEMLRCDRDFDRFQNQALALLSLAQRRQHTRVVLRRGENLVPVLQVHSHQNGLQRL